MLRFANGLGPALRTSLSQLFGLPAVPGILGFDPRFQFIHEDDLAGCLEHAVRHDLEGVYNGAADGVLVLSEVAGLLGKPLAPVLPPVGTSLAAGALRRAGAAHLARDARPAALRPRAGQPQAQGDRLPLPLHLARGGRSSCASTSAWRPSSATRQEAYRYERDLEEFLRRSPSVRPTARRPAARPRRTWLPGQRRGAGLGPGAAGYDDLDADELIALLPSLEPEALAELAAHERAHAARPEVLKAIASLQGWEART